MSSNRKSGAQAPGLYVTLAADLKPAKDEAPAVGAAQGFKNQDTEEQPDSAHDLTPEQAKKFQQDLQTIEQELLKLQYHFGKRKATTYLKRLRSRKMDPEEELAKTVSSMHGNMLEGFCRCLEQALREGLNAKAQLAEAKRMRLIDLEQARFQELATKFALSGSALLRKNATNGAPFYWVAREFDIESVNDLDAAERFLQQLNTSGSSHAAT
jgi:hypothetical protein